MTRFVGLFLLCCWLFLSACDNEAPSLKQPEFKTSWSKTELDEVSVYAIAGDYYEAKIGVSGNQITGVYRDPSTSSDKACWFFFEGTISSQNPILVNCYDPTNTKRPIRGEFKILGDIIIMQLKETPAGNCTEEFTDNVGRSIVLDLQQQWSAVRIVQHKASLYETPNVETTPRAELLPRGTAVAIRERRKNWLLVDILSQPGQRAWLQEHELYALLS
ncbi:MAG: hypothetical protein ACRBFS_09805 [Aureispira sp.]